MLRFGSLFSGIEAATFALEPLGWKTEFVSEVEPTACSVLRERLPGVRNAGDVTAPHFVDRALPEGGRLDVLIGGSPCQAFSVNGLRRGLSDPRGRLTLRFVELADEFDAPITVWENVAGVLSAGRDNAFGCLLAGLAGEEGGPLEPPGDRWPNCGVCYGPKRSVAWRRLRAERFGLAAVRDRVLVVASSRPTLDAFDILAESEEEVRDHRAHREAEEEAAARGGPDHRREPLFGRGMKIPRLPAEVIVGPVWGIVDGETVREELSPSLTARTTSGGRAHYLAYQTTAGPVIREMTVAEQERFLGFGGDWTEVVHDGEILSKTARSKLIGNTMPVPLIRWLGRRIERALVADWAASDDTRDVVRREFYMLARVDEDERRDWEREGEAQMAPDIGRLSLGQSTAA